MIGNLLREVLRATDWVVLGYFVAINTSYLVLMVVAAAEFVRHRRRLPFAGTDDTFTSQLTPAVSILIPAHNERAGIVSAAHAVLSLRYPKFETIVIDDGSTDDTFEQLRLEFDLVAVPKVVPTDVPVRGEVQSVHVPRAGHGGLLVVRKSKGGKADALNVGLNLATSPLVCMVDADSLLDPDALLLVAKPFADDPNRVVATGGEVRIANGCTVLAGRVIDARMSPNWLCRIQVVEYLRAFLLGRTGWSRLGGLLVISGAFGLFRRDLVVEVGGLAPDCIGEDADLVVRLHRHLRDRGQPYRVVFVTEPVSWSEAPSGWSVLARQRRRWHRGLTEILIRHRPMLANPRYGRIGLLALPYYLVFELLAPVVELSGVVLVPLGLVAGAVDIDFVWHFLLVAYCYAILISLIAVAAEELSFHRYRRWHDLAVILAAAVLENIGYRQLTALWRIQGAWAGLRRHAPVWGQMTRAGVGVKSG
jgi:cellulose synthase/poly-beta-1,6-N-acetylglucosamine synthase-like glycosyltransferase